jgi:hypothetical protein
MPHGTDSRHRAPGKVFHSDSEHCHPSNESSVSHSTFVAPTTLLNRQQMLGAPFAGCPIQALFLGLSGIHSTQRAFFSIKMMYHGTLVRMTGPIEVERIQTGVRMEKRLLKVLKAVAELKDMTLGDLLEGIVLHAFEGKSAFSPQTLKEIEQFRSIYGLTLHASDSHRLKERK